MGKRNTHIQGRKGQQLAERLKGVDLNRVAVVAIDAAKDFPKALICNYFGEVLENSFFFGVNVPGILHLHDKIQAVVTRWQVQRVLVGIESSGHYHEDVVRSLERLGYEVTILNAYTTKEERNAALNWAKTDDLDLVSIARALVGNKGTETKLRQGIWHQLFKAVRARRAEVKHQARLKIEIRVLMDDLWREFQGLILTAGKVPVKVKIFDSFWCQASRFLMENYPDPADIIALGKEGLQRLSQEYGLRLRPHQINTLLAAAHGSIPKQRQDLEIETLQLKYKLEELGRVEKRVAELEDIIEGLFVQTPGILLLSIQGVGVTTAAEFIAEVGPIWHYTHARQIIKKAGTNPLVSQTGGKEARYDKISRQGNPALRGVVTMIGKNLCRPKCRNSYFLQFAARLADRGKDPAQRYVAAGNKFIKVAFAMLRDCSLFIFPEEPGGDTKYTFLNKLSAHRRVTAVKTLDHLLSGRTVNQEQVG